MAIPIGHTPVVIDQKQPNDGSIAILIECDGDPKTDSWHTLTITSTTTSLVVQAWIDSKLDDVANLHAAVQNAGALLSTLVAASKVAK